MSAVGRIRTKLRRFPSTRLASLRDGICPRPLIRRYFASPMLLRPEFAGVSDGTRLAAGAVASLGRHPGRPAKHPPHMREAAIYTSRHAMYRTTVEATPTRRIGSISSRSHISTIDSQDRGAEVTISSEEIRQRNSQRAQRSPRWQSWPR